MVVKARTQRDADIKKLGLCKPSPKSKKKKKKKKKRKEN